MPSIWANFASDLDRLTDQVGGGGEFRGAFIQDGERLLGQVGKRLGICQPVALLAQFFVLTGLEPGCLDLLGLEGEHFGALFRIPLGCTQLLQFTADGEQVLLGLAVGCQQGFDTGVTVEQTEMGMDVQQRKMFGLTVDVHQALRPVLSAGTS